MTSPSRSVEAGPPTVVFLHLGKTAGATLRRILRRNVPGSQTLQLRNPRSAPNGFLSLIPVERFAELPEAERARPRLIMAHMEDAIHAGAGTAAQIKDRFAGILASGLTDYIVLQIPTGDMTLDETKRTMDLFINQVKPQLEADAVAA